MKHEYPPWSMPQKLQIASCWRISLTKEFDLKLKLPEALYRVCFLTGPPNFQYRKEKRLSANQSCCYMKFFIKESLWLARWPIFFSVLNRGGPVKKNTLYIYFRLPRSYAQVVPSSSAWGAFGKVFGGLLALSYCESLSRCHHVCNSIHILYDLAYIVFAHLAIHLYPGFTR